MRLNCLTIFFQAMILAVLCCHLPFLAGCGMDPASMDALTENEMEDNYGNDDFGNDSGSGVVDDSGNGNVDYEVPGAGASEDSDDDDLTLYPEDFTILVPTDDESFGSEDREDGTGDDETMEFEDGFGPIAVSRSSAGFYAPLDNLPNYDCTYRSSNGLTYTTLFDDNEDFGALLKSSYLSKYPGSYCDTYDNTSGKQYQGQYCGAHPAVDIAVREGTPTYAIWSGSVYKAENSSSWGNYIILKIQAKDLNTGKYVYIYVTYAHLKSIESSVRAGATVSAGQLIGKTGHTGTVLGDNGDHLHFQIDRDFTSRSHPYWPSSGANVPDWNKTSESYTYNPLTAIGFGTCY